MARNKVYAANEGRLTPTNVAGHATAEPGLEPLAVRIDLEKLLGPEGRISGAERTIDLSDWLGRGIDAWVLAAAQCFKSMLLSGRRQSASVVSYATYARHFFTYLVEPGPFGKTAEAATPADLTPAHINGFITWLQNLGRSRSWKDSTIRSVFKSVKSLLSAMFEQGLIQGDRHVFFTRSPLPWRRVDAGTETSLSDAEQERLATAIKSDLVAIHHGRLVLKQSEVQSLRLLVVSHRRGANLTPMLELRRDAMKVGILPGTVRLSMPKHRNQKIVEGLGRAAPNSNYTVFSLAEGAVLQQAIDSTRNLVEEARPAIKNRVWLFRQAMQQQVTCLSANSLADAVRSLVKRHNLQGDDGQRLRISLSRLRKSFFDRALRATDGDIVVTANLMGNTPNVAGRNYPSMNNARRSEAALFMNDDYLAAMREVPEGPPATSSKPVQVLPAKFAGYASPSASATPVSSCSDTVFGEHAPKDGHNHCDRYVMCLFCASFAVVGTVEELWRLFSFQTFARAELAYLDHALGQERSKDERLEDLRDRYRLAIPFIDELTQRQFGSRRVSLARAKAKERLHPYWQHQMTMSRRGRRDAIETPTSIGAKNGSVQEAEG